MVQRWKEDLILSLTVLLCATGGGYLGGKMALPSGGPAVHAPSEFFGSLPPGQEPLPRPAEPTTVIVIVLNQSHLSSPKPQSAVYQLGRPLNTIHNLVNFI